MKKTFLIVFLSLLFSLFILSSLFSLDISGGHTGNITSIVYKGNHFLSCAEDGFLVKWNIERTAAVERFQLTTNRITAVSCHPLKDEICIIENAGFDNYRISAWNYSSKEKLFTLHFSRPLTYVNYSAAGSYIIIAGPDGFPLKVLDSSTGKIFREPLLPEGDSVLGITGRAERNMMIYQARSENFQGRILYYDFVSYSITGSFSAPGDLSNVISLNNNRYLAGVNRDGLLLIDAASGAVLDTMRNIDRNALLCPLIPGQGEFYCFSTGELFVLNIDGNGRLVTRSRQPLFFDNPVNAVASGTSAVLASAQKLFLYKPQNRPQEKTVPFSYKNQTGITEIAAGKTNIAVLAENGRLFFLPLDFPLLEKSVSLAFTEKNGYNRLSALSLSNEDFFILWQNTNTVSAPLLLNARQRNGTAIGILPGNYPLRAISAYENRLLSLDSGGNLNIFDFDSSLNAQVKPFFSFYSIGAIDAAFTDRDNIILCRSVISKNSPFLSINTKTEETVPYNFPAQAGLAVYSGRSGKIYGAVMDTDTDGFKTVFIDLLSSAPGGNIIFEYPGEASGLSMAELFNRFALSCGSEGAKLYGETFRDFERTNGLPVKLLTGGNFFLCLDSEGNIAWYNANGRKEAVFSLHEDRWTLKTGSKEITGVFTGN